MPRASYVHIEVIFTDGTEVPIDVQSVEIVRSNGYLTIRFLETTTATHDVSITYPLEDVKIIRVRPADRH